MTLIDLKPTGYIDGGDTGVSCQFLDASGYTIDHKIYTWFDVPGEGIEGQDWAYGWYDDSMVNYNNKSLIPGDGVWLANTFSGVYLQRSGEVPPAPVEVTLLSGGDAKLVINPMPVDLTMADMYADGYTSGDATGITCQFLDESGYTIDHKIYTWFDVPGEGIEGQDWAYGWYDDMMVSYNSKTIPAGTGVWMASTFPNCKAYFKSPIQKEVE